jgi:signal transduction histidine kinase
MWKLLIACVLIVTATANASAERASSADDCDADSPDCVVVGKWNVSLALGAGVRSNPLVHGQDLPLVVVPQISYYGKRFYIDNLDVGFTAVDGETNTLSLIATPGYDRIFFYRSDLQNIFVNLEGASGPAGGSMIWLWPLTRDLRSLESSARRFGDRSWNFNVAVNPRSPVYSLAATFRKMAARIDGLIASHRDMSNAVSHEIRTPLSRMQFEIELAQAAGSLPEVRERLIHIKADIGAINELVNATMGYAILERADVALNMDRHDFAVLIPAIAESAGRDAGHRHVVTDIRGNAGEVICDVHLLESAYKNLLYNAMRFARHNVRVTFEADNLVNRLTVEDDGPGIPIEDRGRIFESFVQLKRSGEAKQGFGLGLAIVKRVMEWHNGSVVVDSSPLGGARFIAAWPAAAS